MPTQADVIDLVLVGLGPFNGLLAWRLMQTRSELAFAVIDERRSSTGRDHWTLRGADVTKAQLEWLWVLSSRSWPSFDVVGSTFSRRVGGGFHSIDGSEFRRKLSERLGDRLRLGARAVETTATMVRLATGEQLDAKAVLVEPKTDSDLVTEPFEVTLRSAHAFEVPVADDLRLSGAVVAITPRSATRLLIEVTRRASDAAVPNLLEHLAACGLQVEACERIEPAVPPSLADAVEFADGLALTPDVAQFAELARDGQLERSRRRVQRDAFTSVGLNPATAEVLARDTTDAEWVALRRGTLGTIARAKLVARLVPIVGMTKAASLLRQP